MRQQLKRDSKKILRHQIGKALAIAFMVVAVVLFFWAIERLCAVTLGVLGFEMTRRPSRTDGVVSASR